MKKFLKTGKKTLSVIMAIMMLMTAWVWVAPTEASAAAGKYYVRVYYNLIDRGALNPFIGDTAVDYTGPTMTTASAGVTLYHKADNGTATGDPVATNYNMKSLMFDNDGTDGLNINNHIAFSNVGFPTEMQFFAKCGTSNYGQWYFTKITVAASSSATEHTLWEGKVGCEYGGNAWQGTINVSGFTSNRKGTGTWTTTSDSSKWIYPYAKTSTWSPTTLSAMTCPKTASDAAATQKVSVTAKDQYGVQMFDPTWKVSGNIKSTGITVNPTTSSGSTTISVTSSANILNTTNSQTGTVTATWSTPSSTGHTSVTSTRDFTINDAEYKATFKNHRNSDGVLQSDATTTVQYGVTPTAPTASDYSEGDYDYTFTGWSPSVTGISADTTYIAGYSKSDMILADYSAVNEAIAAANAIKANYGTEYELKYTHSSRLALDSAINAVVTGLGRTQQSTVGGYAQAINDAIAGLKPNKYAVIFLDNNGAILKYEKNAEYKTSVEAPSFPEEQKNYHDATNHYTYSGWDTNEYTSVLDDLVISPVYTAEAHDFKTTVVDSTCVQSGTNKHECKTCGYTYYDGGDELGEHDWKAEFTIDVEPTCILAGSKSIHCSLCDARKDVTAIEPKGHSWESFAVAVNPTCTNIGISTRVCAEPDCRFCEHLIIDALEHDYKENVVEPTCTTKGYTEYICKRDNCGYSYKDKYTEMVEHKYPETGEVIQAKACGVTEIIKYTCSVCGYAKVENGETGTHDSKIDWTIVVSPTCEGKGYQIKICSKCDNVVAREEIGALTHDYKNEVVAPTCTTKGYTKKTCQRENCGDVVYTDETSALNHAWTSTTHAADCTHSAYIEHVCANDNTHNYIQYVNGSTAKGHTFTGTETIVTPVSCEADGEKTVKCADCDVTTTVIIPKLGHKYSDWEETPATNSQNGSWYHKCENCGKEETLVIPAGNHNFVEDKAQYKAPKCNEKGQRVYKCTAHNNCIAEVVVELDYAQHSVAQREIEATCTKTGSVEAYCSTCTRVLSTEEIPVKAHNLVAGKAVAATCTSSGYIPYACACGTFSYKEYNGNALTHDFSGEATVVDATCKAEGSKTVKCSRCETTHVTTLPKVNHKYTAVGEAVTATCTTPSTQNYECDYCGDDYIKYVGEIAAHQFNTLVKTVPATNDSLGYEERKCDCGLVEITILEATGTHVFNEKIFGECTAPTCTENGTDVYKCTAHADCGAKSSVLVPRLGHTVAAVYNTPTCDGKGSSDAYCTTCKTIINTIEIPAKGHYYNTVKVTENATCTAKGTRTYACACGDSYTEEIPAKGHSYKTTVTDAKCGEKGSVVTTCTACTDVNETTELAVKGHIWKDAPESTVAAKCETDGSETYKCQNCDKTNVVVLPKLGHSWGDWSVTKASTNTAKGEMTRTCSRGCTEKVEIPAGGHSLVVGSKTDASCTQPGSVTYICDTHKDANNCGITVTVTLDMLQHELVTTKTDAKCEDTGYVTTRCKNCETATIITEIPATGHTYNDGEKTDASCTETGKIVYTCTAKDCTKTRTVVLDKLQHNYKAGTPVDATCTSNGYTPYTCKCGSGYVIVTDDALAHSYKEIESNNKPDCTNGGTKLLDCEYCDSTISVDVPALGHDYELTASTDADCANGATETYTCKACDDVYTEVVSAKTTEHDWNAWITEEKATNTSLGYKTRTCKTCGKLEVETIQATGEHKFDVLVSEKAPGCETTGEKVYSCSTHKGDNACGRTSTVTIPANGHTEKLEYKAATCNAPGWARIICEVENCGYVKNTTEIPSLGHLYEGKGEYTAATCVSEGSVVYTCSRTSDCKEALVTEIAKNPDAHKLTTTTVDATCAQNGSVTVTCLNGCGYTAITETPKLPHTWNEWKVTEQPTNSTPGTVTRTCSAGICTETAEIPAGGHSFKDAAANVVTSASCTSTGTVIYKCTAHVDCGVTITVTTDKTGHTPKAETVSASCTNEGSIKTVCSECEATLVEAVTLGKLQHVFEQQGEAVEPTCTSSGYTTYKCKSCNEGYKEIGANATGHDLVITTTGSTCTEEGSVTVKCNDCNLEQTSAFSAPGHAYVEISSTEATCAVAATKTYKCSNCSAAYTVSVGGKTENHDWKAWTTVVEATENAIGYETRVCKICDKLEVRAIEAKGEHRYIDGAVVEGGEALAATCTENGYETRRCSVEHTDGVPCTATGIVTIPATGHSNTVTTVDASCDSEGSVTTKCSKCDTTTVETIPALGHIYGEGEVTPATCKSEGNIKYTCSRCGDIKNVTIDRDEDAHSLVTDIEQADCENNGTVTVTCVNGCDYKNETVIPAKGHTYNAGAVTKDAGCESTGTKELTCTNCGNNIVQVIPALGHDYEAGKVVASTCTTSGYTVYTCKNNEEHKYNVYNPDAKATGHDWNDWTVVTDATETTEGLKERTCKVDGCDGKETEIIPAMAHNMVVDSEKASSCKEAGYIIYKCDVKHDGVACDYTLKVDLPKTAHTIATTVNEASCTSAGSVVTKCTVDGCTYKLEDIVLAQKPHDITVHSAYPSCSQAGYVVERCDNNCGYEKTISTAAALGHSYTGAESDVSEATCTAEGSKKIQCSRCDAKTTVTIPAKGHSYELVKEENPTCTESGYAMYKCSCGDSYKKLTANPVPHTFVEDTASAVAPTCEAEGKRVYKCSCGAEKETVVSKLGHSWVWTLTKIPTASQDGILTGTCANSGCNEKQTVVIPALGGAVAVYTVTFISGGEIVAIQNVNHEGAAIAPVINKASNEDGHYILVWDKDFSKVTSDLTVTAQFVATAHTYGEWIADVPASCNAEGRKHRDCTADGCGFTQNASIEKTPHDFIVDEQNSKAPTCTDNGSNKVVCSKCNTTEIQSVKRLGHQITFKEGYAATCNTEGRVGRYECTRCNKLFKDRMATEPLATDVIPMKYHTFVIVEGFAETCTTDGLCDYMYCPVCGFTQNAEPIPATGHTDKNNDNVCDKCGGTYTNGGSFVCSCSCHKSGFFNEFIYKILSFFWKLFGTNKVCECGNVQHY